MSRHVKDKISLYIDGKLEGAALQAFEKHVKTCGECGSALALTKQAVKAAKGTVKDAGLPVNFYVKLNKKLDAVDAAGKAPAFNWGNFARGAVAVCTMLVVGVLVYTLNKQTGNFSDVRMKQDAQMPAGTGASAETKNAEPADGWKVQPKPAGELAGKKAAEQEITGTTPKALMNAAEKKDVESGYNDYMQKEAALDVKMESLGLAEKPVLSASRSVKSAAPAPAAKMKAAASYEPAADAGTVMDEALAGESAVAETETKSMETAGAKGMVFKDESAWKTYAAGKFLKGFLAIDWTRQMVVAVLLGSRPTAGYSVEITGVEYLDDRIVVSYREHKPEPGSMTAQVITYPHAEKVVNRSDLPVEFREVQ